MAECLQVEGLSVRLGGRNVLSSIAMTAPFSQITAILGPNGAGKSTLLRAICGLVAHKGRVTLHDQPLATLSAHARAQKLSFVPQRSELTAALEVHDLVMQGRYVHRRAFARPSADDERAVDSAMRETDVARFAEHLFSELSYGEQRRVLLARALATGARAILLDEPTAALDIEHTLRLHDLLRRLANQGCCVVLVLHDLEHALSHTDRAVLLNAGHALAEGPTRDVLAPQRVREVYGVEMIEGAGAGFRLPERSP